MLEIHVRGSVGLLVGQPDVAERERWGLVAVEHHTTEVEGRGADCAVVRGRERADVDTPIMRLVS